MGRQNYFFPISPDATTQSPTTVINCCNAAGERQDPRMSKRQRTTTIPCPPLTGAITACEFCLETFVPRGKWPPKVLPCGHNFCEECIQSLCLYTEYYLLDSIRCPKCQQPCENRIALKAPTNRILCKKLQPKSKKPKATSNVTVIHVSQKSKPTTTDKEQPPQDPFPSTKLVPPVASQPTEGCQQPNWRCSDCKRRLNARSVKSLDAISRFCECNLSKTTDTQKFDALTCLQCCVDRHNGHSLLTLTQLEKENHKLVHELRQVYQRLQHFSLVFQQKVGQSAGKTDFSSVIHAKQVLMRESQQCYHRFTLLLENHFLRTLPSDQVFAIRSRLLSSVNRLQRMCSCVEGGTCTQSFSNTHRSNNLTTYKDDFVNKNLTNSLRDFGVTTATASISTLLQLYCNCCEQVVKEQYQSQFSGLKNNVDGLSNSLGDGDRATGADERVFALLKDSVRLLNAILDERIAPEMLLLFESAFVHSFKALNSLSKKAWCANMSERRQQLWKLIQSSFSELLRLASLHWSSANVDRVEVVADLALLCCVFPDVCDTATLLLCMIEAARARASWHSNTRADGEDELNARRMEAQLKVIDDCLLECRRIQKLNELRSQTRVIKPAHHKKKTSESKSNSPKWFWNRWLATRKYSVRGLKP